MTCGTVLFICPRLNSSQAQQESTLLAAKICFLIAFSPDDLKASLRWETSRGGALFPHLYGTLKPDDARWVEPLPLGPNGHIFPDRDLV